MIESGRPHNESTAGDMNKYQIILFLPFLVCSTITNVLWYRAKTLLRERGFPTSLFTDHFQDLKHLAEVAAINGDPQSQSFGLLRSRIKKWLFISLGCFAALIIAGIIRMVTEAA